MTTDMRHPENAAEVRAIRPVTSAADVPRVEELRRVIQLGALGAVEPGDVFYLAGDPSTVWLYDPDGGCDGYAFGTFKDECWRTRGEVADASALVVVLHNTRKYKTAGTPAC